MARTAPSTSGACSSVPVDGAVPSVVACKRVSTRSPRVDELCRRGFSRPRVALAIDRDSRAPDAELNRGAVDGCDDGRHDLSGAHWPVPARLAERLNRVPFRDHVPARFAEPAALVDPPQTFVKRLCRGFLKPKVDRRLNGQAVLVELLRAVAAFELAADLFEKVRRRRRRLSGLIGPDDDRFFLELFRLCCRNEADLRHPAEGVVAPAHRRLAIHIRALADVALEDAGDQRCFLDRDILG